MKNTKQKVLSNLIWRFAERIGAQLVGFVVSVVLARLLLPEDYGTIALITVFTTIMQVFVDSGLGNALIQKKDADDMDFSTVFYTNILFCVLLYLILFFTAPLIAGFYNNEALTVITRVLGITILISGVKNVQQAYVSKNMIFKKFFFATLTGTIGAGIIGIILAVKGFGVWALVVQQLFNLTVDTLILWITVKWRPKLIFSFKRLKVLFSFGCNLLIASVLDTTYNNLRQLLIGKLYTSSDLAFYNKAKQFPELIINNINTSMDSVLLPAMSQEQEKREKVRAMTRRAIKTSIFIMAPLMVGLAITSNNVISILLTDKWLPCVPYLCVFCMNFMFYPIHTANLNAIKSMGEGKIFLKLEIVKKVIGVILLLITMRIGVMAMALSLLVSGLLSQIINSWPNKKLLNYSYLQQLKDIMPSILNAFIMGIIIYTINLLNISVIIKLTIQVILGAFIYILGAKILKIDSFDYILNIIKNKRRTKMKILITGANGMLAKAIRKELYENELICTDVADLDITDFEAVKKYVKKVKPNYIINCAAYTAVDKAEENEDLVYKINAIGPKNLAMVAKENDAILVHISTDYVFGGDRDIEKDYNEDDEKNPQAVYGTTKLAGEKFIEENCNKYYIFRTAWLYGEGHNFVRTMIKLSKERNEVKVVNDQHGSPTYAVDLASIIHQAIEKQLPFGIYNSTNIGYTTWYDFTKKIFKLKNIECKVIPVTSEEFKSAAKRPKNSKMSKDKLLKYGIKIPTYEDALERYLKLEGEKNEE